MVCFIFAFAFLSLDFSLIEMRSWFGKGDGGFTGSNGASAVNGGVATLLMVLSYCYLMCSFFTVFPGALEVILLHISHNDSARQILQCLQLCIIWMEFSLNTVMICPAKLT